ncbi:hypothetical protein AQ490_09690 [Wenjunlia vitaminophila]|uniref:DUF402 domain-containing protein n=1 Tax=Wenjunlia vitaminophila TaxID=76728 RepID=A0A0T6LLM9_WENVI|nr:DUF402 domain-containing protein [Wenjunlia vitaminophila]KRV47019.1 hypothetical protein AQ490_09690 [Wenjunlia vitaminophila]
MTAETVGPQDSDGAAGEWWTPGDTVLWRYRGNASEQLHICRPVTVVHDGPDLLAVWLAPGTTCVRPVLADGSEIAREPLDTRFRKPRAPRRSTWFGTGVLKLARAGDPWSVWLFWDRDWRLRNWYVNLEEPRARWAGGVDSEDHVLDIAVYPDRSWEWKDEDEFVAAQEAGLIGTRKAATIRAAGRAALREIEGWGWPFRDHWEDWRPDPAWGVPALPADWDRDPADLMGGEEGGTPPASNSYD